jgi:hypothetical protein
MNTNNQHEQQTPDKMRRWQACYNGTYGAIPAFALMQIVHSDYAPVYWGQSVRDGQVIVKVQKPDDEAEKAQDPAMLCVNGPTPIPPNGYGMCTQDWPAAVLHDGGEDRLPNGFNCGPKSGSWFVWSTGWAFTCQSHDAAVNPILGEESKHLVWISPGSVRTKFVSRQTVSSAVAAGGTIIGAVVERAGMEVEA